MRNLVITYGGVCRIEECDSAAKNLRNASGHLNTGFKAHRVVVNDHGVSNGNVVAADNPDDGRPRCTVDDANIRDANVVGFIGTNNLVVRVLGLWPFDDEVGNSRVSYVDIDPKNGSVDQSFDTTDANRIATESLVRGHEHGAIKKISTWGKVQFVDGGIVEEELYFDRVVGKGAERSDVDRYGTTLAKIPPPAVVYVLRAAVLSPHDVIRRAPGTITIEIARESTSPAKSDRFLRCLAGK